MRWFANVLLRFALTSSECCVWVREFGLMTKGNFNILASPSPPHPQPHPKSTIATTTTTATPLLTATSTVPFASKTYRGERYEGSNFGPRMLLHNGGSSGT